MNGSRTSESTGCGCIQALVIVDMLGCGILGYHLASQWGTISAVGWAILGAILGLPATGLVLLILAGIAYVIERFAARQEETRPPP